MTSSPNSSPLRLMRSYYFASSFFSRAGAWRSSTSSTSAAAPTAAAVLAAASASSWYCPGATTSWGAHSGIGSSSMLRRSATAPCLFGGSSRIGIGSSSGSGGSAAFVFPSAPLLSTAARAASSFIANPTDAERETLRKLTEPVAWKSTPVVDNINKAVAPLSVLPQRKPDTSREALTTSPRALSAKAQRKMRQQQRQSQELPLGDKVFLQRFVSANRTAAAPDDLVSDVITPHVLSQRLRHQEAVYPVPAGKLSPQLAVSWADVEHNYKPTDEFMVSLKLDGVRCLLRRSVHSNRIYAFSRHGKEFGFAGTPMRRILDALQPLFDKFPKLVLDGEIYAHGIEFGDLNGAVRNESSALLVSAAAASQKPMSQHALDAAAAGRRIVELQSKIQFFAFDIAAWDRIDVHNTPYTDRMKLLHRLLKATVASRHFAQPGAAIQIKAVVAPAAGGDAGAPAAATPLAVSGDFPIVETGKAGIKALHAQFADCAQQTDKPIAFLGSVRATKRELTSCRGEALGGDVEGIMIRPPQAGYTNGRNRALMKHKLMKDAEYRVVGFMPGKGQLAGALGSIIFTTGGGETFRAAYGGTIAEKVRLWNSRDLLMGKLMTVQFQELSPRGIPRFPVVKGVRGTKKSDCN